MREGQPVAGREQPGGDERVGGGRGALRGHPGERGRVPRLGGLEDCERARQRRGLARQARKPRGHPARDGPRPERGDALRPRRVGRYALLRAGRRELLDEEWRPAGGLHRGGSERRCRDGAEPLGQDPGHRRLAERTRADDGGAGVALEDAEHGVALAGLARSQGEHEREGELVQARAQEGEEAQRRGVGPVGVVDEQQQRALRGQVRAEPVEAVEHGEARVRSGRRGTRVAARQPEQVGGMAARALEQALPPRRAGLRERRLEQLPGHPEGELALALGAAGTQHPHPLRGGLGARRRQQRRLAHPGGALDEDERAGSRAGRAEGRREPPELVVALQRRLHLRRSRRAASAPRPRGARPSGAAPRRARRRPRRRAPGGCAR